MVSDTETQSQAIIEARVRRNVGPAGLAAGILIFFGFILFTGKAGDSGAVGDSVMLRYTLRVCGIAMVGVAIASSIGMLSALLADGILSVTLGAMIVVSAVMMVTAGTIGVGQIVVFICGLIFVTLGLRTLVDYRAILRGLAVAAENKKDIQELGSGDSAFAIPEDRPEGEPRSAGRSKSEFRSTSVGASRREQQRTPHPR